MTDTLQPARLAAELAVWVPAPRSGSTLDAVSQPASVRREQASADRPSRDWVATPRDPGTPPPVRVRRSAVPPTSISPDADLAAPARSRRAIRLTALLLLNLAFAGAVLAVLGLAVGPHTGSYRTLTMLTGSMRPEFPPGAVVVVTPMAVEDLRPGQVVTFNAPTPDRRVVTHRVVSVDRTGPRPVMVTKGDANPGVDPWKATITEPTMWRARFAVPLLGRAIIALREPRTQTMLTKVLPGLLVGWLLVSVWRSDDEDSPEAASG